MYRAASKNVAFFLLGAALAIVAQGIAAPELQIEFGQSRFGQERNGTFYESDGGMDYQNYMTPKSGSIAIADKFGESPWGYRLSAFNTGTIKVTSIARYGDDANRQPCDPLTTIGCKARFEGSGYSYGFTAALTYEMRLGVLRVIPEAGLSLFRHRFHAKTAPLEPMFAGELQYDETSKWISEPQKMLGLTLRIGEFYFSVRRHLEAGGRPLSLTNHSRTDFMFGAVVASF